MPEALDHYLANYGELLAKWDSVLAEKGVTKVEIDEADADAMHSAPQPPIRSVMLGSLTWKRKGCRAKSSMIW